MTSTPKIPTSPSVKDKGRQSSPNFPVLPPQENVVQIAPIVTFNEWVVIQPFNLDTNILLPANADYRNVGIVVGKSETVLAPNGARVPSVLNYGDVVLFQKKAVVGEMAINKEPYAGKKLVMLSERNIICKLPAVPFKLLDEAIGAEHIPDEFLKG